MLVQIQPDRPIHQRWCNPPGCIPKCRASKRLAPLSRPRSSISRAPGSEPGGWWCSAVRDCALSTRCGAVDAQPQERQIHPGLPLPFAAVEVTGLCSQALGCRSRPRCRSLVTSAAFIFCPRSPTAETTASEAVQCRCDSCRGHQFLQNPVAQPQSACL